MDRSPDWLAQAEHDLLTAKQLRAVENYSWCCFAGQQAAEKALKSALEKLELAKWGHDLVDLITKLKEKIEIPSGIEEACHRLNLYYVATRYPDAFTKGMPTNKFSKTQCTQAIEDATKVIEFVKTIINKGALS